MERILRALSVSIVIIGSVVAFAVSTHIDQTTISVISGTVLGILIALPCGALLAFVLLRRRDNGYTATTYERQMRSTVPLPPNPPQYWVLPPQLAGMANPAMLRNGMNAVLASPATWPSTVDATGVLPPRRRFYVIGENGEPRAVDDNEMDVGEADDRYAFNASEGGAAF